MIRADLARMQVVLLGTGRTGAPFRWLRQGHDGSQEAVVLLAMPIIYVTGVHLPLLCEARQSLPVKPIVLALAAIGLTTKGAKSTKTKP